MLKMMTSRLMRTTAISLLPIAMMAPAAALAQADASSAVMCRYDGAARTIRVVERSAGGCEVRYDSGAGAGERVMWSAANSMAYCQDKADGLAAKLTNSGFSCGAEAVSEAAVVPVRQTTPAPATAAAATPVMAATAASPAEAPAADSADDEEEFSFDIAEEAEGEAKPVYVNEIEIGAGWVSDDSAKFGEFSGLETEGPFLIGNVNIQMRDPYDDGSTEYFIARGTDLGIESRSVYAEYGRQGQFSIFGSFDSIPKFLHDDARTPYIFRDGGTNLTLPAGWVPSNRDIRALTLLNPSLEDINIGHQREKFGGGLSWLPGDNWSFRSSFFHETKQGTRTLAAIFGSSGGNPAGAIVPEPVDYETDSFDAALAYTGKRGQFALSYNLSLFRDNNESLVFQNPFVSSSWAPAASFPGGFGQLALPPDNHAHRITLVGKYLLTPKTSVTANLDYTRMTQDDSFLPFTINPGLLAPTALPRDSLDGEINTLTANLGTATQVTPDLSFRTSYRYENRDNDTPQDVFLVVPGDSQNQGTLFDSTARINRPYSRKQHLAQADANYRLGGSSKVSIGYEFEQLERDFTEVEKTREHKVKGKFQTSPTTRTSGWVGAEYSVRNGTEYIGNLPFLAGATPEHLGPDPEDEFENHPLLRKYYIADRDRLKVQGAANWTPTDELTFGAYGRYHKDDYDETVLGLTESTMTSLTGDASYQPSERVSYHLFYTYDDIDFEQAGLSFRGGASPTALVDFAATGWTADTQDRVHTAGAGLEWDAIKDKLNIKVDYYWSLASTDIDFTGGTALTFGPINDLETRLNSVETVAEYQVTEQFGFKLRYLFSDYSVTDFALDGVNPDTMRTIIGLGNQAPDFNVHVVGFSAVYKF